MLLLLLALVAHAAPIGFDGAVRAALDGAPAAEIVSADRELALGAAQTGIAFGNPMFEVEKLGESTELRVTVPVPITGAPVARLQAASAQRGAAEARFAQDRAELAYDVGLAYLDAVAAEERATLAALSLQDAERAREAVARLHQAGEVSDVDRAVTEAVAAGAVADAAAADQAAIVARMRLEVWLGQAPSGALDPSGWPALAIPGDLDPAALPATLALSQEARAARARRLAAVLDRVPSPQVMVGHEWGHATAVIYGVGVTVPLFAPGVGEVRSAAAGARGAEAQAQLALLDASASVGAARRRVEAAERGWAAMSAVGGLEQALSDVSTALALGEWSSLDFTARRAALLGALERRIAARYALESARLDLWRLAGQLPREAP